MEEVVMYIVVNKGVKISPGKLAAQVAHVAVKASHLGERAEHDWWEKWYGGSYTKIVLEASEYELRYLLKTWVECTVETVDEGRTEIPKGTLTAIAFIPMPKSNCPEPLKSLKLRG
jgi:PTH2 family peptidyl-tRNA hydrolase